jgi:hypothetical protein
MKLLFRKLLVVYVEQVGSLHPQLMRLGFFRFTTHLYVKSYQTKLYYKQQRRRILQVHPSLILLSTQKREVQDLLLLDQFIHKNQIDDSVVYSSLV